jgi:glycine dehydrogenase subunit 1
MQFGGGQAGFIATRDEESFVMEYPSRLFGVAPTIVEGEYGFGDVAYERTSFALREEGKEWVGTASALWGITAGVYLALMGPQGMVEIGEAILQRTSYAMKKIAEVDGIQILFPNAHHFKEMVVNFDGTGMTAASINKALLDQDIFGGKDISREFPELGESALFSVTEIHSQADIDRLVKSLVEVTQ